MTLKPINFASLSQNLQVQKVISPNPENHEVISVGNLELNEDYLIVLIDIGIDQVFLINLDTTARFPVSVPYFELVELIDSEKIELLEFELDPRITLDEEHMTEAFKRKANRRYKDIVPLLTDLDATIRNARGDNLIADTAKLAGKSRDYIYNTFNSFLRNGCRKWGLGLPQGKDANREIKPRQYAVKTGRPAAVPQGKVPDERDYKAFEWGERKYKQANGPSITKVMELIHKKFYYLSKSKLSKHEQRLSGELHRIVLKPLDEMPTENQFKYWLISKNGGSLPKRDKKRKNAVEYAANNAGRSGDAFMHVTAPGQLYQLDETPFDEEVVSIFDEARQTKLGKATLYFVRDVWSWGIAGVYITTHNPSYATAKEALFNAIRNKADFLEEISSPISPEQWPIEGAPQALLVDNAEFNNTLSEGAIADLPITIKFGRAGRGDDKGLVESMFHAFSSFFNGLSKAHKSKSTRDIAQQIDRKNACLTINELYIIASVYIAHYNSVKLSDDYPLNQVMVKDKVPPIPNHCFAWGLKYRPGGYTYLTEEEVYLRLFEKGTVSIRKDCVYLLQIGLRYNCSWTLSEGIQDSHENKKYDHFPCRYFRGMFDIIYICTPDGLKIATLDNRDRRFSGLSLNEIRELKSLEKKNSEPLRAAERNSIATMQQFLEDYLDYANSQRKPSTMPNIHTIKENRKKETIFDHIQQMNRVANIVKKAMIFENSELPALLSSDNPELDDTSSFHDEEYDEPYYNEEEDDFYQE